MVALRFRPILILAACLAFGGALWIPTRLDEATLALERGVAGGWNGPLTELTLRGQLGVTREPWPFHLVNLGLHAGAVWVAALVLERWLGGRAGWIGAGVFAIHPLQTEALADVLARGVVLSGLMALMALREWQVGRLWRACGWMGAALTAGPAAAGMPLALGMAEWAGERRREARGPLAAMGGAAALAIVPWGGLASAGRVASQGVAMLRQVWLVLVPIGLTPEPAASTERWLEPLGWGAIAAVLTAAVWMARGRRPGFWVAGGFLLLLPAAVLAGGGAAGTDPWMYLPLVFFGAAFGIALRRVDWRVLGAMGLIWMGASVLQTGLWRNPRALWMEAARLAPGSARAKRELARLLPAGQALEMLEEAAEAEPGNAAVRSAIGAARLRAGEVEGAKAEFRKALELDGCLFEGVWNLKRLGAGEEAGRGCCFTAEQRALLAR